jgi:hypothetical protein
MERTGRKRTGFTVSSADCLGTNEQTECLQQKGEIGYSLLNLKYLRCVEVCCVTWNPLAHLEVRVTTKKEGIKVYVRCRGRGRHRGDQPDEGGSETCSGGREDGGKGKRVNEWWFEFEPGIYRRSKIWNSAIQPNGVRLLGEPKGSGDRDQRN